MVDKIITAPKSKAGAQIGRLDDEDVLRLNPAIVVFLGLASPPRARLEGWTLGGIVPGQSFAGFLSRPHPVLRQPGSGQGASTN